MLSLNFFFYKLEMLEVKRLDCMLTYEAPLPLGFIFDVVLPLLNVRPPGLEVLQAMRSRKLCHDFHSGHRSDAGKSFGIIASEQIGKADESFSCQAHLPREIGSDKAFNIFGIVEKILETLRCTEEEHVIVISDDTID